MASSDNYSGPSSFSYDLVSRLLAKLVPADRQQSVSAVLLAAGVTCCCTLGAAFVAKRVLAASGQGNKKNSDVVNPVRYIEGHPIFGAMLEINGQGGPVEFQKRHMKGEDSEAVWTHLMGPTYFLKGSNMVEQFNRYEQARFAEAKWFASFLKLFGENSALAMNGKEHLAQRKIVLQANNAENLAIYFPLAEKTFINLVKGWTALGEKNEAVETQDEMNRIANAVNARYFMGDVLTDADFEFIRQKMRPWKDGFTGLPIDLPFTAFGKAIRARKAIGELVGVEIERRRKEGPPKRWDLLQGYIEAIDPLTDEPYTLEKIKEMFPTILFGALDTTVGAECLIAAIGAEQPESFKHAMIKIREEIDEKRKSIGLGPYDPKTETSFGLSYGEVFSLPFLKATVEELLRLTQPGPNAARKCLKDMKMTLRDGREFTIPAGANVWVSLAVTCWDDEAFKEPKKFDPERFLPPREEHKVAGQYGIPIFGFGARLCPGQHFARAQISLLLMALATQRVEFRYKDPKKPAVLSYLPALEAVDGVWVIAKGKAY